MGFKRQTREDGYVSNNAAIGKGLGWIALVGFHTLNAANVMYCLLRAKKAKGAVR